MATVRKKYDIEGVVPGLTWDGRDVVRYWSSVADMSASMINSSGLQSTCADLGTRACLVCDLADERYLEVCDFGCRYCRGREECSCSRIGWESRNG